MTTRNPSFSRVLYCVPTVDEEGNLLSPGGNNATVVPDILSGHTAGNGTIADAPYSDAANANGISNQQRHFQGVNSYITADEFTNNGSGTSPDGGIDYGNEATNRTNQRTQCEKMVGTDTGINNRQIAVAVYGIS